MTEIVNLLDSETVAQGGGTSEVQVECFDQDTLTLQVLGDPASTDFDLVLEGRLDQKDGFGLYSDEYTGQDITSNSNNSRLYGFDVSDLNDCKIKITNNAGASTTIDVVGAVSDF